MTGAILKAGAAYFGAVFAAGFVLGVMRTLWLEPALGPLGAVALELPFMLGWAWWVCTRVLRRWPLLPPAALAMGGVALLLLLAAEAALSVLLAGRSVAQHVELYTLASHQLGLAGQGVFALFPWLQCRRPAQRSRHP
jgi:hypothetical protein